MNDQIIKQVNGPYTVLEEDLGAVLEVNGGSVTFLQSLPRDAFYVTVVNVGNTAVSIVVDGGLLYSASNNTSLTLAWQSATIYRRPLSPNWVALGMP